MKTRLINFVATAHEEQRKGGRHAHIDHPWQSRAWMTRALCRLRGQAAHVDQCAYGLEVTDLDGRRR